MTTFWFTFRIEDVGDASARRQQMLETISHLCTDKTWWVEPTSFVLFRSEASIDHVARAIRSAIDPSIDLGLLLEADRQAARAIGAVLDADLYALMPYAKSA